MKDEIIIENQNELVESKKKLHVAKETLDIGKLMEMSTMLAKSTIVPVTYQNRPENCFIALDMASRMGVSPMIVMQNLYVVMGKPSWSGQAIASFVRTSKKFEKVELHYIGEPTKDSWGAYVTAINTENGKLIKGATVTMQIAKQEGWYQKSGSKWKTMPELMLSYRAYAWFGRVHAPEIMMGLHSVEEVEDVETIDNGANNPFENGDK